MFQEFWEKFITGIKSTGAVEYVAVFAGILSVWFSKRENILVYPVGLVNTIFYVKLSLDGHLPGEAIVNIYYTLMSIYGWIVWSRKDRRREHVLKVSFSSRRQWMGQLLFFAGMYVALFFSLTFLKRYFYPGAIPWADAFASAAAFTGMWLMARKKVESWWWWILTNIASIPLYFQKDLVFTSVYYIVLFVLAIAGLQEWQKRARAAEEESRFEFEKQ